MANKYLYSDIVLTKDNYNPETKKYQGSVKTNFFWTIDFELVRFDEVKETAGGARIVGEILLSNGDKKGIFENERDGRKTYGATLAPKPNPLYLNLKPLLSSSDTKEYKVSFVELEDSDAEAIKKATEEARARVEVDVEF
jgi:hypothetical protein